MGAATLASLLGVGAVGPEASASGEPPARAELVAGLFVAEQLVEQRGVDPLRAQPPPDLGSRAALAPQSVEGARREASIVDEAPRGQSRDQLGHQLERGLGRLARPLAAPTDLPLEQLRDAALGRLPAREIVEGPLLEPVLVEGPVVAAGRPAPTPTSGTGCR